MMQIVLLCVMLSAVTQMEAERILVVVPVPSFSHQIVFRPIARELARRGHEVTVITTNPNFDKGQTPANFTEINVHDISYKTFVAEVNKLDIDFETDMGAQWEILQHLYIAVFEQQLQCSEILELIKNKNTHFDLIVAEGGVRLALIFSHIFKAHIININSFGPWIGMNALVGAPNHPIFQPNIFRQRIYNLTMWEKVRAIYSQLTCEHIFYSHEPKENAMLQNLFGHDIPSLSELYDNVQMVFINEHPIWNDNQPIPPNVILMGGIHLNPANELPEDLESYLDSSRHGVIYLSFGTNIKPVMLPPQKIKMMMKVLSELPYDILWKWDSDLPEKPKNVRVLEWWPQSDLLLHPNVKLFITQGGLQSTDEAITGGVPLIGIPVFTDQWYNTEKYVRHGIGLQLNIRTFTEEQFRNAVLTVIGDHSYRNNVRRLRNLMRDEPQTALERAIWWTEYVLRHGGTRHLRSTAANMSWAEYYELNLVCIVFLCLFTTVMIVYRSMILLLQYVPRLPRYALAYIKLKKS